MRVPALRAAWLRPRHVATTGGSTAAKWAALLAALAPAACSGGGGGTALPPATIVAAAFVGAGATPVVGDTLVLVMSQDVTLTGALLTDQDLTLSSGTLGAVTAPPTLVSGSARAVQVVLGAGVSFTPGTTTVAFSAANDAVEGATGTAAIGGTAQTITTGDGDNPTISAITLNGIESALNGTGPAGGVLQVPQNGFTINVTHSDPTSPINGSATVVTCSANVATPAGVAAAGADFASQLTITTGSDGTAIAVPGGVVFPEGDLTVTVVVVDATGMSSNAASFPFRVKNRRDALLPFEATVNAQQVWYLDTSRDVESYTHQPASPTQPVAVTPGANGRSDLEDLFHIVGLLGSDTTINATVLDMIKSKVLADLAGFYSGANVSFTFTSPGTFPSMSSSVPYANASFSQICIAGAEQPDGSSGVLGVAIFDEHNETQDDDCRLDFGTMSQRLGVFIHTLVNSGLRPTSTTFRATFDDLTPGLTPPGTPIGNASGDDQRLAGTLTGARTTTIHNAINRMGRAIAMITAHECGHSVGLVADLPMPSGLYGGDSHFPGSTSGHIINPSFTGNAQNIMSPAISFTGALDPGTGFNSLNLSYLRQTAYYGN